MHSTQGVLDQLEDHKMQVCRDIAVANAKMDLIEHNIDNVPALVLVERRGRIRISKLTRNRLKQVNILTGK